MFKERFPQPLKREETDGELLERPDSIKSEARKLSPESFEAIKDKLFDSYMLNKITESFFDDLEEYVTDLVAIEEMRKVLSEYGDEAIYAALSWPAELRKARFSAFNRRIEKGELATDIMRSHVEHCIKEGYGVGYHTSPHLIRPDKNGHWGVMPTEADHRDDDLVRAYYSRHYRHLFRQKDPEYIYVVRTEAGTHKTDGNWGRASGLAIVASVPYAEVVTYVEDEARKFPAKKKSRSI